MRLITWLHSLPFFITCTAMPLWYSRQPQSCDRPGSFTQTMIRLSSKDRFGRVCLTLWILRFAKAMLGPADLLPGVGRRLRKRFVRVDPVFGRPLVSAGDLAEYHVRNGVDDIEILQLLCMNRFRILEHLRYPAGRTWTVRFWNKKFRLLENFKIIAQRDS